jgi:putative transposase
LVQRFHNARNVAQTRRTCVVQSSAGCDDNPYAEALFRTLKYRPGCPRKPFESIDAARWVAGFVAWYNRELLHSAIRYVTPDSRHERRDAALLAARHRVYRAAYTRTPSRWSGNTRDWTPIGAVALNPSTGDARRLN